MVDSDDDLKIAICTTAITIGRFDVAAVIVVAAGCAMYHYTLIRERDRMRCFTAFRHNSWPGTAQFAGLALDYLRG